MESKRKIDSDLGLFIYRCIASSNITYEQLAKKLDVSIRIINYYCNGERKPNQRTLLKLIKVLNVDVRSIPF